MSAPAPRRLTFSLAHLLLAITGLCICWGLAVNFPGPMFACFSIAGFFGPTVIVWYFLVRRSDNPIELSIASLIGAITFALMTPALVYMGPGLPWWQENLVTLSMAAFPALGTLVFGGFTLLAER
jgi:hypothetical protein